MPVLPVYVYNHPVLKQKAAPLTSITPEVIAFIEDMFETMYHANGIGLAANQVGSSLPIFVVDITGAEDDTQHERKVFINPEIISFSEQKGEYEEGCLSVPDLRDYVDRPLKISVKYRDINFNEIVEEYDGLMARVIQHETDHLNGIYFFERLSSIRRTLLSSKLKKIQRGQFTASYKTVLP